MATKTYKSGVLESVHQMIEGFYETGAIDKKMMREFDESCLIAAPVLQPAKIKAIRESESVSQPVFARTRLSQVSYQDHILPTAIAPHHRAYRPVELQDRRAYPLLSWRGSRTASRSSPKPRASLVPMKLANEHPLGRRLCRPAFFRHSQRPEMVGFGQIAFGR